MMDASCLQLVGKIVGAHGLGGELKIFPLTSWPERFFELTRCFIDGKDGIKEWAVTGARLHGNKFVLLKLEGVDDRTGAELFKGRTVSVHKSERVKLEVDEYFLDDLIGCTLCGPGGESLGKVVDFHEYGGNGLLVAGLDNRDRTVDIPFVDEYVERVDIDEGRIVLAPAWTRLLDED